MVTGSSAEAVRAQFIAARMTADPARGKPSAATGGAEIDDMPHAVLSAGAGEVVADQVEVVEARLRQPCRRHHRVNEVDADVRSRVLRGGSWPRERTSRRGESASFVAERGRRAPYETGLALLPFAQRTA